MGPRVKNDGINHHIILVVTKEKSMNHRTYFLEQNKYTTNSRIMHLYVIIKIGPPFMHADTDKHTFVICK